MIYPDNRDVGLSQKFDAFGTPNQLDAMARAATLALVDTLVERLVAHARGAEV